MMDVSNSSLHVSDVTLIGQLVEILSQGNGAKEQTRQIRSQF